MKLLGPTRQEATRALAASEQEQEQGQEKASSGLGKLLLFSAVGFGLFKIFIGNTEEELDGF